MGNASSKFVDVPPVFTACGGGAALSDGGSAFKSAEGSYREWATVCDAMSAGLLTFAFRVDSERLYFGVMTGADPVPADWGEIPHPRAYRILNESNGFVHVLGAAKLLAASKHDTPRNRDWRPAPRGSEVECTLDMDARTLAFTVNGSRPWVAFTNIKAPVRPIFWGGSALLLRVRFPLVRAPDAAQFALIRRPAARGATDQDDAACCVIC